MDPRSKGPKNRGHGRPPTNTQLFEDTSMNPPTYGYPSNNYDYNYYGSQPTNFYNADYAASNASASYGQPAPPPSYPGQQLFNDPMANMAMQYGQTLAGQGTDLLNKNIEKYVSKSNLKFYFSVDTSYVVKKIGLLIFPFAHKDWSVNYSKDEPQAPRSDVNARDLYIPVMAFVTYTLLAGLLLGMQNRFSPEQLGVISSTALIWTVLELTILLITRSILNIQTGDYGPSYLDWLAFCGYKYVGMIMILMLSVMFQSTGYYCGLVWMSLSLAYFLVRSLKVAIQGHSDPGSFERGNKRKLYMMLLVSISQPLLMWWLTRKLAISDASMVSSFSAGLKLGGTDKN
ncbi:hypothetical protein HELRODRAFT_111184 [Helobdella robusta]|uniref:Protein YIF1 n=1 Tax=Helobdella robusta TaxID=6412 RepID=T1EF92_HELRO|nr:hypothetical protein HELRODRAFT_111184 [Helobdella robusta]ESO05181.1 hypothetical protein HELRODRAFT_111184 [Helobdella robusta]